MNLTVSPEPLDTLFTDSLMHEARRLHLLHQPPADLAAWRAQRRRLLAAIRERAGSFPTPPALALAVHRTIPMDGYELRMVTYQSRPGLRVTAHLAVPAGQGPFPAVLQLHGHWQQGKIAERVQQRLHVLAREGFVVLAVDAFGAGERGTEPGRYEYHGRGIGASLFDIGETLLGMQVYDNMRGIDLLASLPQVNPEAIGVTGASGGGNQTMWVSALDARVKAAVPVVSVGTFESYVTRSNCMCEVLPDGLPVMEEWAVLGLVAPNALLLLNSLQDGPTFCVPEMVRSFHAAREVYRLYGASDKIAYQAIDLPHGYWPEMQRAMLGWFRYWLQGRGTGRPCELPAIRTLPEQQVLCFPAGRRPKTVASIVGYVDGVARGLAAARAAPGARVSRAAKRAGLRRLLRMPVPRAPLAASPGVRSVEDGIPVLKQLIESPAGGLLPIVWLRPQAGSRDTVLAVHPGGKAALADTGWLAKTLARGTTVVCADLSGTGESAPVGKKGTPYHEHARACLWLGRTVLGDWAAELLALADWIRAAQPRGALRLAAFGEAGLAALAAAALSPRWAAVTVVDAPGSWSDGAATPGLPLAVHVPGILKWGDVSMLAALAGCPLELRNPVHADGRPYTAAERRARALEIAGLARRLGRPARLRVTDAAAR